MVCSLKHIALHELLHLILQYKLLITFYRYCLPKLMWSSEAYWVRMYTSFTMTVGIISYVAMTLDDGKDMVQCIWLHCVLFRCHAAINQLRRGISKALQLAHLIKTYPKEIWGLFAASNTFNVTVEYLCEKFSIKYFENGSNNRIKEEAIPYDTNFGRRKYIRTNFGESWCKILRVITNYFRKSRTIFSHTYRVNHWMDQPDQRGAFRWLKWMEQRDNRDIRLYNLDKIVRSIFA